LGAARRALAKYLVPFDKLRVNGGMRLCSSPFDRLRANGDMHQNANPV